MSKERELNKQQLAYFGRSFALLFNRSFMYSVDHPFQIEAINTAYQALTQLLQNISPTVFILNRKQFYIDEEPLDPRLNVSRVADHFKRTGIESISFYKGVEKKELQMFLKIATTLNQYPNAEAMSKAIFKKRIDHIKINHIFYKKVSAEDEVISRDLLDKVTPEMMGEDQDKVRQMFMDSVFSNIFQEEFIKNLNLKNLLTDPGNFSREMIASDLTTVKQLNNQNLSEDKNAVIHPGKYLLKQLEVIDYDVEKNLSEGRTVDLPQIAEALSDMRQKLIEGIEAQKALGVAYSNEAEVFSRATEITDKVLIRIIKEEYKGGETSLSRLAQILSRIIPEADELKRLLPKIKTALIEEGMPQDDFISLIRTLGKELQNEGLANILSESAEEIGVDGSDIIKQIKENPLQSAEMIYLASEIRKSGGDEKALTDLLVNYVEQVGSKYSQDLSEKKGDEGEKHIQKAMVEVKSSLLQHLGKLDIKDDLLKRLEERVNRRMDEVFNNMRSEWINSHLVSPKNGSLQELTVLETLERSVSEDEDLAQILKIVREKVESGEIDENDFEKIYPEIVKQEKLLKSENGKKTLPSGIMREQILMNNMEKEILRAKRYKTSISILGFTLVKARAKTDLQTNQINKRDILDALLLKLVEIFRTPDIVGEVRKNLFIALLPMTDRGQANLALKRAMKIIHLNPLDVSGVALEIKVAGVVSDISLMDISDAESLVDHLSSHLKSMATRIGNIHFY